MCISALDTVVAFSVGLQDDYFPEENEKIPYNSITSNVGGGFIIERREFVCSVAGVYAFYSNVFATNTVRCNLKIMKSGTQLGRLVGDHVGTSEVTGSNLLIVELEEADTVYVERANYDCGLYGSGQYTSFSGFRLG